MKNLKLTMVLATAVVAAACSPKKKSLITRFLFGIDAFQRASRRESIGHKICIRTMPSLSRIA